MKKSNLVITNNNLERIDKCEERELLPHMSNRRPQVRESKTFMPSIEKTFFLNVGFTEVWFGLAGRLTC
jgi:hypothetical protein